MLTRVLKISPLIVTFVLLVFVLGSVIDLWLGSFPGHQAPGEEWGSNNQFLSFMLAFVVTTGIFWTSKKLGMFFKHRRH